MTWTVGIRFKDGWRFVRGCDEFGHRFTEFEKDILWLTPQDAERIRADAEDDRAKVLSEADVWLILREREASYEQEEA